MGLDTRRAYRRSVLITDVHISGANCIWKPLESFWIFFTQNCVHPVCCRVDGLTCDNHSVWFPIGGLVGRQCDWQRCTDRCWYVFILWSWLWGSLWGEAPRFPCAHRTRAQRSDAGGDEEIGGTGLYCWSAYVVPLPCRYLLMVLSICSLLLSVTHVLRHGTPCGFLYF